MKIIVLALANDAICDCSRCKLDKRSGNYADMVKASRQTWANHDLEEVKVYYIYGHRDGIEFPPDSSTIKTQEIYWPYGSAGEGFDPLIVEEKKQPFAIDDCIYSDTPEGRGNLYYKTLDGFQWLLENEEFDYILRVNCGSYIDLPIMLGRVQEIGIRDNVYRGVIGYYPNSHNKHQPSSLPFASGAAFLTSRNLIENIVENRNSVDHVRSPYASRTVGDDVTFAHHFVNFCGAELTSFPRKDIWEVNMVGPDVKDEMHCYFRHTINPDIVYAVHKAKGREVKGEEI